MTREKARGGGANRVECQRRRLDSLDGTIQVSAALGITNGRPPEQWILNWHIRMCTRRRVDFQCTRHWNLCIGVEKSTDVQVAAAPAGGGAAGGGCVPFCCCTHRKELRRVKRQRREGGRGETFLNLKRVDRSSTRFAKVQCIGSTTSSTVSYLLKI